MARIDLDLSFNGLIDFAKKALEKGEPLECAMNLNEALEKACTKEEKHKVYALFVECYRLSSSVNAVMHAITKEIETRVEEEFYRFDFPQRRKYVYSEESEDPDYDTVYKVNDIKNMIIERQYDEAMLTILSCHPTLEQFEQIIEAMNDAVDSDKDFDLDKYIMHVVAIMTVAICRVEVVRLMLTGGSITHRMAVEHMDLFLDDEDSNALCLMGMAYFENDETEVSRKFFRKALEIDPIDEDALYYMAVLNVLEGRSDNVDYWGRYKEVYRITEPPIALTEKFFRSEYVKELTPYREIPPVFAEKEMAILAMLANGKEDITDETAQKLADFYKLAPEQMSLVLIDVFQGTENKPKLAELYKNLLASSRVPDLVKEKMYIMLLSGGYEGDIIIQTETKIVCIRLTKLHKRVHKAWNLMYKIILKSIPFTDIYLPIRCGDLAYVVKELDGMIHPDQEDIGFCMCLILVNYIKRLRINVDFLQALKAFQLNIEDIDRGMKKHNMENLFIQ